MAVATQYLGQSQRGPSGRIWGQMDVQELRSNPTKGLYLFDDFLDFPTLATTAEVKGYYAFLDTSATATSVATDDQDGVALLTTAATDNNSVGLTIGNNIGAPFRIDITKQAKVAFEARIKLSSVADYAMFIGLAEEGLAANDTLADNTGAVADKDLVGFRVLTATPTELDAFHKLEGASEVETEGATATLAAATWVKIGFTYDYMDKKLRYYVNNTLTATSAVLAAASFPSGEGLVPLIYLKTGEGVDKQISVDWISVAQQLDR